MILIHQEPILLWPAGAPGSAHLPDNETVTERSETPEIADRAVTGITRPSLTPWLPLTPNGTAVIIAPGGAYLRQAVDKEGADICEWLNSLGITAFILKYRLPDEGHDEGHLAPLQDTQRALRLIRAQAADWNLDSARIGIAGFSAGGHLAGSLMTSWDYLAGPAQDDIDTLNARPDFVILGYPVCGVWESLLPLPDTPRARLIETFCIDALARPGMAPAFIFHADDDPTVPPTHSIRIFNAIKEAGLDAELHIYQTGGHGFGIRRATGPAAQWPSQCAQWMRNLGMIPDNP